MPTTPPTNQGTTNSLSANPPASVDSPPSFLGPNNPISKKPPSRSQSPAKRLKSEEPPSITLPNSLDSQDTVMDTSDRGRGLSVEMLDAFSPDDAAGGSGSQGGGSSTAPSTTTTKAASLSGLSTAATSVTSTSTPPSSEEQVDLVLHSRVADMKEGEDWYIVSGQWLKRFLAQDPEHRDEVTKAEVEKPIGPIDNSSIVDTEQMAELERRKSEDKSQGSADDQNADDFIPLKQGAVGEEFEMVPQHVWDQLVAWYGLAKDSPVIKRKVVNTAEEGLENLQVELHPPMFTLFRLRDPSTEVSRFGLKKEKDQKPKKVVVGRGEGFQKFLKKVKNLVGVDSARKVRIWKLNEVVPPEEPSEKGKKSGKSNGTFKQMALDLQAFLDLAPSEQRELINIEDSTQNPKYNGHMKLGTAGLGGGGMIVVEEQGSDGEWVSETPIKQKTKFGEKISVAARGLASSSNAAKKKISTSRSSSPSKGSIISRGSAMFTRSRERREGRPRGTCGLGNMGNTCYMNSALQCLRGVEELSEYFLSDEYEKELNPTNPLAHHGKVAKAYAGLLKSIFASNSPSSFAPREFKNTIGRFGPSFSGYQQQDSQEFLAFLLDGLHEDLNRIAKKPYIEKPDSTDEMIGKPELIAQLAETHWDIYKKRNNSAVADLFAGLYKSTLVCPECQKVSITFDPFMDLTLPLPIESLWSQMVVFYPKDNSRFSAPVQIAVELQKHAGIGALKDSIGKKLGIDPKKLMGSEVYKSKYYKHYEDGTAVGEQITGNDVAVFYELEDVPTNWPGPKGAKKSSMLTFRSYDDVDDPGFETPEYDQLLVPIFHKRAKGSRNQFGRSDESYFSYPSFVVISREDQNNYEVILEKIVNRVQLLTTKSLYNIDDETQEEEESVEEVKAPKEREGTDDEKDGFVNVSMKDATSVAGSDESEKQPAKPPHKKVPKQVTEELFDIKVATKKHDRVPTGWSSLECNTTLAARMDPSRSPIPPPPTPKRSVLFGSLHDRKNSGNRSPASVSDDDNETFMDAQEPDEDMMRGSSDEDEDQTSYSNTDLASSFTAVRASGFNGSASHESSSQEFRSSPDPPSPPSGNLPLIRFGEAFVLEWKEQGYDALFGRKHEEDFRGMATWNKMDKVEDPALMEARRKRQERKSKGIHLEDCLDEFAKEEILSAEDPWWCPKCKEHRRASKKFELWKCPDILVIHLKRFSSSRSFRDKIDALIQCPIEGLDLSQRVGVDEGKDQIYDLFAVDNHYGGLGGGHYTAHVKNWLDQKWYYCDDASVREATSSSVITPAAYLLFYRRRSDKPLGGPEYEKIHNLPAIRQLHSAEDLDDDSLSVRSAVSSRAPSPAPPSSVIGPQLPPPVLYGVPVGNTTLWGESMPLTPDADSDTLPSYDQSTTPAPIEDEGMGESDEDAMLQVQVPVRIVPGLDDECDGPVEDVRV